MGISCGLHLIAPEAFAALSQGDLEGFDAEAERVDLDCAWHAISYLVTGKPDRDFLGGGVQLADVSEHCEAHSPEFVAELSLRLGAASADALLSEFNTDGFCEREIYPGDWDKRGEAYLRPYLDRFVRLVHRAADEGKGILVVLA